MTSASTTLAQAILPNRSLIRNLALVGGGALLTTVAAQVQIPWQPVPFTLQTLAVMLVGLSMGARLGALSQLAYLAAGLAGAPVYAGFSGGFAKLAGPTGGYLVSFVLVAGLLGWMSDRGWTKTAGGSALALAAGALLNLTLGTLWLSAYTGLEKAFLLGFAPFVVIEAVKATIAVPIIPSSWKLLRR